MHQQCTQNPPQTIDTNRQKTDLVCCPSRRKPMRTKSLLTALSKCTNAIPHNNVSIPPIHNFLKSIGFMLIFTQILSSNAAFADDLKAHDGKLVYGDVGAVFAGTPLEGVTPENFDPENFVPLEFPFSKDSTRVWAGSNLIPDADSATFNTIARNQAKDATTYYFREANKVDVPYNTSAEANPDCFGWAKIDEVIHYRGSPRNDVDPVTYQCVDFTTSMDRAGIYVYGDLSVSFDDKLNFESARFLSTTFITDGDVLFWIGGGQTFEITNLDLDSLEIVSNQEINDGNTTVFCDGRSDAPCR